MADPFFDPCSGCGRVHITSKGLRQSEFASDKLSEIQPGKLTAKPPNQHIHRWRHADPLGALPPRERISGSACASGYNVPDPRVENDAFALIEAVPQLLPETLTRDWRIFGLHARLGA